MAIVLPPKKHVPELDSWREKRCGACGQEWDFCICRNDCWEPAPREEQGQ